MSYCAFCKFDRLNRTDLVVDIHHADEHNGGIGCGIKLSFVNYASFVYTQPNNVIALIFKSLDAFLNA